MSEEIVSLSQFKATATTMLKKIKRTGSHVILTQNGAAAAVVQDMETFENNQKAIFMLKLMVQGEADISQGHLLEQKAVFRDIRKKLHGRNKKISG
jgi:prevent-host-death family protein